MRFQSTLIIVLLSFSIPGIIGIGYWINSMVEGEITSTVLAQLESISDIQENRVNENIEKNFERLQGISSRTQLRISLESFLTTPTDADEELIKKIISDAKNSISDIQAVYIVDNNGMNILSTESKIESFGNGRFSLNNNFNTISFDKDFNQAPSIFLIGPLELDGKFLANLIVKVNSNSLDSIAEDYTGLGLTGETFLAKRDENGNALFITSLRFDPDAQLNRKILKESTEVPITQALLKNENQFENTIDYRGAEVLSSTRFIESADWGLVVKIDKSEAFAILDSIQLALWLGVGIFSALMVVASIIFSNQFSRPIQRLREAVFHVGTEDFSKISPSGSNELRDLGFSINQADEKLKESMRKLSNSTKLSTIGQLGASMAHDLRNPLSTISMNYYNIEKRFSSNFNKEDSILFNNSKKASKHISGYIEDVLSFLRNVPTKKEELSLQKITKETVSTLDVPEGVKIIYPENDVSIIFDINMLKRILVNLIDNAIEATSPKGQIKIRFNESDDEVTLEIEDSAQSLKEEQLSTLFEPLYTTKKYGTGLGLPSVKNILDANKGKIFVKINPTRFIVVLPKK